MAALHKAHVDGKFIFSNLPGRALKRLRRRKSIARYVSEQASGSTAASVSMG